MLGFSSNGPSTSHEKIVLIHGFTQAKEIWHLIVPKLLQELNVLSPQVISVDLPGHGESGSEEGNLSQAAQQIVELCPAARVRRRVHVRDVVRDHFDVGLLGQHSRASDVQ